MRHRIHRRALLGLACTFALPLLAGSGAAQEQKLPVAATFSILGDITREIGGERIALSMLAGPGEDAHAYQPRPDDAKRLAAAKVIIVNGLGFEGFLDRMIKSSGAKGAVVTASKGVKPIQAAGGHAHGHGHSHGKSDPHAWQSVQNVKIYAANIRDGLIAADPAGREHYQSRAAAYLVKLDALDADIRVGIGRIPEARRRVISDHNAFQYFTRDYGVAFLSVRGLSTAEEPSARAIASAVKAVREAKAAALLLEKSGNPKIIERIAAETGLKPAGALHADTLTGPGGEAPDYISMMRRNLETLVKALGS